MKRLELFPTLVTTHLFPQYAAAGLISTVKNLKYRPNEGNQTSILDVEELPSVKPYFDFFRLCLTKHGKEMAYTNKNFFITQGWVNKSKKGSYHFRHFHPNSFLSGIFYVNASDGATVFHRKRMDIITQTFSQENAWNTDFSIKPHPGMLIVFPSYLEHSVLSNNFKSDRYTISFNSVPRGPVGSIENRTWATF